MIKIAVIGIGKMGNYHMQKVIAHDNAELTGIYDIDNDKAKKIAEERKRKSFDNIEDAISNSNAIVLASPTTTHYEIARKILKAGKHILIEKPIASSIEEADELVALAKENSVKLAVGHIENFNPALVAAFDYIQNPVFVEAHRLSPFVGRGIDVSVIMDLMIHDIEILLRIMGKIKDVHASGGQILTNNIDIASARIGFEKGIANVTASRISDRSMRKMRIFSKGGYVSVDFANKQTEIILAPNFPDIPDDADEFPIGDITFYRMAPKIEANDQLFEQLSDFIMAIDSDREPFVSGENGLAALKLAHKIQKDIE